MLTKAPAGRISYATDQPTEPSDRDAPRDADDDLAGYRHRQVIGYLGLALPLLLVQAERLRPNAPADQWAGTSISAYYWTGAVSLFAGLLAALAIYLITYDGYDNRYRKYDRAAAIVAGIAAAVVALVPTTPPPGIQPPWWVEGMSVLHAAAAVTLFSMFAVFSLWLFRVAGPPVGRTPTEQRERALRDRLFLLCGVGIVVSMLWALAAAQAGRSIFWPESMALGFFAWSWLAKGRALRSIKRTARAVRARVASERPARF